MSYPTLTKELVLFFLKTGQMTVGELAVRAVRDRATVWRWAAAAGIDLDDARERHCDKLWAKHEYAFKTVRQRRFSDYKRARKPKEEESTDGA